MREKLRVRLAAAFPSIEWSEPPAGLDDDNCLRWLYTNLSPMRHLEFGTWKGEGVMRVLESCPGSVWTLNLEGEKKKIADKILNENKFVPKLELLPFFTQQYGIPVETDLQEEYKVGEKYIAANCGHRVNQIYCDSRQWEDIVYPDAFFDSVFIDGGHNYETARSDMFRALRLLKPGGLFLMHDFCPNPVVNARNPSTVEVTAMVWDELPILRELLDDVFYIEGTWILCGARKGEIANSAREKEIFEAARERAFWVAQSEDRFEFKGNREAVFTEIFSSEKEEHVYYSGFEGQPLAPLNMEAHAFTEWFACPNGQDQILRIGIEFKEESGVWQCVVQQSDLTIIGAAIWPSRKGGFLEIPILPHAGAIRVLVQPSDLSLRGIPEKIEVSTNLDASAQLAEKESLQRLKDEVATLRQIIQEKDNIIHSMSERENPAYRLASKIYHKIRGKN